MVQLPEKHISGELKVELTITPVYALSFCFIFQKKHDDGERKKKKKEKKKKKVTYEYTDLNFP